MQFNNASNAMTFCSVEEEYENKTNDIVQLSLKCFFKSSKVLWFQ